MCEIQQSCENQAIQGQGVVFAFVVVIYMVSLAVLGYVDYWHSSVCHNATIPCHDKHGQ